MTLRRPRRPSGSERSNRTSRRPLTGRALILGAVIVLLVVLLAAPLHRFLAARSAVSQAVAARDSGQRDLTALEQADRQYSDPAYIQAQARTRLQYAMPGDTVYQIVDQGQQSTIDTTAGKSTTTTTIAGNTWNERLWGSLRTADQTP